MNSTGIIDGHIQFDVVFTNDGYHNLKFKQEEN